MKQLYGVRIADGKEEFVFLKSYTGESEKLDDPYANFICNEFGDNWSSYK